MMKYIITRYKCAMKISFCAIVTLAAAAPYRVCVCVCVPMRAVSLGSASGYVQEGQSLYPHLSLLSCVTQNS